MRRLHVALVVTLAAWGIPGCASDETLPENTIVLAERAPAPDPDAWRADLERIDKLITDEREDDAIEAIAGVLDREPPATVRGQLQSAGAFARKQRFHRKHPLFLELTFDRERYAFGDTAQVRLTLVNLGSDSLTIPARHRSWFEALTLQDGERSSLILSWRAEDADGRGSDWSTDAAVDVPIENDIVLEPGGRELLRSAMPLGSVGDVVYRRLVVSAILRPVALVSGANDRRYDPLVFPEATARVFRREDGDLFADGLTKLREALAGESPARPASIFVLAMGLPVADLRAGIDLLARSGPSLDTDRRRPVIAALRRLSGKALADDAVRYLDWWTTSGSTLEDTELAELAGFTAAAGKPRLAFDLRGRGRG